MQSGKMKGRTLAMVGLVIGGMAAAAWAQNVRTETAWPTGQRSSSVILIERTTPAEVRVGAAFDYELRITNLTAGNIGEVTISEQLAPQFDVKSIEPQPADQGGGTARWTMNLGPSESKVIRINGVANGVATLEPCNMISFSARACQKTVVVQPALQLAKTMPAEVLVCDPIPIKVSVTNNGTGTATDVKITDNLPEGLTTPDGRTAFLVNVGTLRAGETREATVEVRAARAGTYVNEATASEAGGLTATASAQTVVRQPVLEVTKRGPELVYVGRPIRYEITVTNRGDGVAKNTVLTDTLDSSISLVEAADSGQASAGRVTWNLGNINPGESKSVSLTGKANEIKTVPNLATATAYCAEAKASISTVVKGIPALLLEVEDLEDPIEVGAQVNYAIVVTNQGSANATNIVIKCTLPAEEDYVAAKGPTKEEATAKSVVFAPVPSLAPKEKTTFRVTVKGVAPNDVRFAVEMTSDQLTSPVNETESTHIYQ